MTSPIISPKDIMDYRVEGNIITGQETTAIHRDGSESVMSKPTTGTAPGPGKGVKSVKTFTDLIKGLKPKNIKSGLKYVQKGKNNLRKAYKAFRRNGFTLIKRTKDTRILENSKTGEKLIFRKSKSGGYKQFDSITQPAGNGKNNTLLFE